MRVEQRPNYNFSPADRGGGRTEREERPLHTPFYDPSKSYDENFRDGPFGPFADGEVFVDKGEPQREVFGKKIYEPFGIAAGPLINGAFAKAALDKGFSVVTYKTARTREYPCQGMPNVLALDLDGDLALDKVDQGIRASTNYRQPLAATNSFGVPSRSPEFWQEDLKDVVSYAKTKKGRLVIGSFQGTPKGDGNVDTFIQDHALGARLVKETGVDAEEVNLSCPNEGKAHLLCFDTERTKQVVEAVKGEIGSTPLSIKIAYFQDNEQLRELVKAVGGTVDGITAINTISAKTIDKDGNPAFGKGRERTGVCGAPIKWAGLDMVGRLKDLREEFGFSYKIIGVGGVTNPQDYSEYRAAGADLVESATGAIWNPFLAQQIKANH